VVVLPIVAAVFSAAFGVLLFRRRPAVHRRTPQTAWGIALLQYSAASVAVAAGTSSGWDPTLFRIYWLFGALLSVPWLAFGSIALLGKRFWTLLSGVAVVVGTGFAVFKVAAATVNPAVSGVLDIPRGRVAWEADPSLRTLADVYSLAAYVVVVALAILTSRPRRGMIPAPDRVRGNLLIALGVSIVAVGSTALARLARGGPFSVSLILGVVVMSAGFVYASRPPRFRVDSPGESPT